MDGWRQTRSSRRNEKYAIAWIEGFGQSADRDAVVDRMREGPPSQSQDDHLE
jgi:hypothetical protein